jgi:hypothetical protein
MPSAMTVTSKSMFNGDGHLINNYILVIQVVNYTQIRFRIIEPDINSSRPSEEIRKFNGVLYSRTKTNFAAGYIFCLMFDKRSSDDVILLFGYEYTLQLKRWNHKNQLSNTCILKPTIIFHRCIITDKDKA